MASVARVRYTCGALLQHPFYPVEWWYVCALGPNHDGDHVAIGSDPERTWPRSEHEVYELEVDDD